VKIKLDENIGKRGLELLRSRGHDTSTVYEQGLSGAVDEQVFGICAEEGRVLITLDRDFGEVLRFPPSRSAGVVILAAGSRATRAHILNGLEQFLMVATTHDVAGQLWIVEPGRVRIHIEQI
jgi:predicted nuclease of predicted toxin-antitoxin system